jgi:hypothetical protein
MYYLAINRDPYPEAVPQAIAGGITTWRAPSAAMTACSPSSLTCADGSGGRGSA